MKRFLVKIGFFAGLLLLAFSLLAIGNYYLIQSKTLDTKSKSTLLLGDSNMECAINDGIYKSSINKSASSDSYFYSYLKLKKIIESDSSIDTVLLSFAPHNIFDNGWLLSSKHINSRLDLYYPLMEWADFRFLLINNTKAVLEALPTIAFRSLLNFVKVLLNRNPLDSYGRFLSLDRNILSEVQSMLKNNEPMPFFDIPDSFEVSGGEKKYLDQIIKLCSDSNIKLYFINTPKRYELLEYQKYGLVQFYEFYDNQYTSIEFIDFSNLRLPEDSYGDFVHLNVRGSTAFSELIRNEGISNLIKKYGRSK